MMSWYGSFMELKKVFFADLYYQLQKDVVAFRWDIIGDDDKFLEGVQFIVVHEENLKSIRGFHKELYKRI